MNLSIIIVNYNTKEYLEKCLASVAGHRTKAQFETFVVDNASSDGSCEMVAQKFPSATLIKSPTNIGFGPANNLAIARSTGRHLVFLNSDAELTEGALDATMEFMGSHPSCGIMGGRLLYDDMSTQVSACPFPSLYTVAMQNLLLARMFPKSRLFAPHRNLLSRADYESEHKVEWVSGAFLAASKTCIDKIGPFDEGFFLYYEETDLCKRAADAGFEIWYNPKARAMHHTSRTTAKFKAKSFEHSYASLTRYFLKHRGIIDIMGLKALLIPVMAARIAWLAIFPGDDREESRAKRKACSRIIGSLMEARK